MQRPGDCCWFCLLPFCFTFFFFFFFLFFFFFFFFFYLIVLRFSVGGVFLWNYIVSLIKTQNRLLKRTFNDFNQTIQNIRKHRCHKNSCFRLCSFTHWLLQFSPVWLSTVSLKQTSQSSKQRCSPCDESPQMTTSLLILWWESPKTDHISPHLVMRVPPKLTISLLILFLSALS